MTAILIAQPVAFAAILWLVLHAQNRALTQSGEVSRLLVQSLEHERDAHRQEVQTLLQRIQAPEVAVLQHAQEGTTPEAIWPLSDDESAEAQDDVRTALDRIATLEAEGIV
jgi:hypothetical protein